MIARLGATAVAGVALAAALAGCSGSSPSADAPATASTDPASSSAPAAPATPRPLSDFVEDATAPGQNPFYSFGTSSGQIQCRVVDGSLACQTDEHPHTVAESALCGFYPGVEQGNAVRFGFFEGAPVQPCATIIQGDGFRSPHTLAYGEAVSADLSPGRTVTCSSAVEGLTCTLAGGTGPRGFVLSVDAFTVF